MARTLQCNKLGREAVYELDPTPLQTAREYLDAVSAQWDAILGRLKAFVED